MSIILKKIVQRYHAEHAKSHIESGNMKYIKLYELLKQMILAMEIPENSILPPTRALANELLVSRSTILRSYDFLIVDGLVISKPGSGYVLKNKVFNEPKKITENEQSYEHLSKIGKSFLKNNQHIISSSVQNLAFSPGLPPLDIFPVNQWKNLSNMYWKEIKFSNLSYSPSSGIDKLKMNIAHYLNLTRNIDCEGTSIIITSGSLQSLYLIGCTILNPGEKIFMEDPTFPNVKSIFKGLMANIIGIPLDKEGINVSYLNELKTKAKIIHTTPSCHYPTGLKMTMERRLELLAYAHKNNSIIIENDYEHELNNWHDSVPSIFSLDKKNRTIYLGTFNRLLHPSLRIGYMIVPPNLKLPIELLLKHSHRFVAPSIQVVLNQFIEKKFMFNHISNVIKTTIERKQYFHEQFQEVFKDTDLELRTDKTLSLQSLISLKGDLTDDKVVSLLEKNNISAHSFNKCFINDSDLQGLIVGHATIPKPLIKNKISQMFSVLNT